jgi:aminopeptidase-like protein
MPRTLRFCMAHKQFAALPDGMYEVLIDAGLEDGSLIHGENLHQGRDGRRGFAVSPYATPRLPTTIARG